MTDRRQEEATEGELLRLLVKNVRDYAILVVDPEGLVRTWSQGAERLLGYREEEILGRSADLFTIPEDIRDEVSGREIREARESGRCDVDRWHVRVDGTRCWVSGVTTPLWDEAGNLLGFAEILRDRTDWWHAEESSREAEGRFRTAFAHAAVGMAMMDAAGRFVEVNPAYCEITGYGPDELLRKDIASLTHPEDLPRNQGLLRRMLDGEIPGFVIEKRYVRKDGGAVWVKDSISLVRDDRHEPFRIVALTEEISRRKEAEATIAEQVRLAEYGREIGLALAEGVTLSDMLGRCAEASVRHLDGAFARIWTVDEAGEILELRASAGMYTHLDGPHSRIPVGQFKIGQIARERKPHLTNAVVGDPRVPGQEWARREGMIAFAGYPLVVEDRLVGVLAMFARHRLSDATLQAMASVADGISVGIERKRAEERLHRQREWMRVTLASISDAVIATDLDGRITFLNGVAETLTGWTRHDAEKRPLGEVFRIVNERSRQEVENPAFRALREGAIIGLANHTVLITRDGTERAIDDSAAPIRDERGVVMGAVVIFRDIDERRRAERALEASEARKAAILETALDAIITIDHEGKVVEWNPAAERVFGHDRGQVLGREMSGLIIPTSLREANRQGLARYLETGEGPILGRRFESTAVRADGTEFPVELAITRINADGPPLFTAHLRDITERLRVERALREGEEQFRTMAESIPQLAWMARPDGHIYWYNKRWHEYTGTTPEAMEGWGWRQVHDPEVLPEVLERWMGSIASGEPFDMVFPLRGADGQFRPFLTRVAPVRGEDGRIAHWFGTNTDISDRRRIEEELRAAKEDAEAANRAKSQFLAVLSHELRTPLNPILLAVTSMLERRTPPEEVRSNLEMIRQNVNLQSRLIDDLLDVMRIVQGKLPLHWEAADCHGLIDQALRICRSEVLGGDLRVELDLGAREHIVNADPARFQQVIWNLIKNAVKFTPGGGLITIRTRNLPGEGAERLVVEVADTGIGIEPEILPLIFDPFQQGETRVTRKFGGLGLGLAICRGIVEAHGGTLTAESPGKDLGTTFRIVLATIPSSSATHGEPSGTTTHPAPTKHEALRILIVEDEPTTLRLMASLLHGQGHVVTTASSITTGYEAFEAGEFDLIVSDIGLPDGTGLELIRRIVALRGRIPAIALTGYGMEDDINRSREAGFTAHMTKPIDFNNLEAMINHVAANRP